MLGMGEDVKHRMKWIIWIILFVILLGLIAYKALIRKDNLTYDPANEVLYNPFMGFAPNADYVDAVGNNRLVYVDISWREWEPEKNQYDIESVTKDNYLDRWKKEGKNVVLRFISDCPKEEPHMDIPDYLYKETNDGTFYDISYGKGYSPNYENEYFIDRHKKAIEALGDAFGKDDFVTFVELGSIGHWGEWHVKHDEVERLPGDETLRRYVEPYVQAFPNAFLLMRRPFSYVKDYSMGIYNDMQGEPEDTGEWLGWIQKGGEYAEPKTPISLCSLPEQWKQAPIGGEFTSSISMDEMLTNRLGDTIEQFRDSHTTFSGPQCPVTCGESLECVDSVSLVLKNMGYRFRVPKVKVRKNRLTKRVTFKISLKNIGVAPFYKDWPVFIYAFDSNGTMQMKVQTGVDLRTLYAGQEEVIELAFSETSFEKEHYQIAIGIENPRTQKAEIAFDMCVKHMDNQYILFEK